MFMHLTLENGSDDRSLASQGIAWMDNKPSVKHVVLFARREGQQVGFHEDIVYTVVLTLSSILSSSVENNIN